MELGSPVWYKFIIRLETYFLSQCDICERSNYDLKNWHTRKSQSHTNNHLGEKKYPLRLQKLRKYRRNRERGEGTRTTDRPGSCTRHRKLTFEKIDKHSEGVDLLRQPIRNTQVTLGSKRFWSSRFPIGHFGKEWDPSIDVSHNTSLTILNPD